MSSLASKLQIVQGGITGRQRQRLGDLRTRWGSQVRPDEKSPDLVIVEAMSKVEWWRRLGIEDWYELERAVHESKPVPVTP